jgi:ATP-dependent Clp protease ATP-binding subunit ClpA
MTANDELSPSAKAALARARAIAVRLRHDSIGTEHMLFGIAGERSDIAGFVLHGLGVTPRRVLARLVPSEVEAGQPHDSRLELTKYASATIGGAIGAARRAGLPYALSGHLLLGLLEVPNCSAVKIMSFLGVDREEFAIRLRAMYVAGPNSLAGVGIALDRIGAPVQEETVPGGRGRPEWDFMGSGRVILESARRSAKDFDHWNLRTDHLLLGITADAYGLGAAVLQRFGLRERSLRLAVRLMRLDAGIDVSGEPPWSRTAIAAMEWAIAAARRPGSSPDDLAVYRLAAKPLRRTALRSEHVLLGLIETGEGAAMQLIESFGLPRETLRRQLNAEMSLRHARVTIGPVEPDRLWVWINKQLIRTDQSVADLAQTAGVRKRLIQEWVRGTRRPSARSCDALAAAFGADPNLVRRLAGRPELPLADISPAPPDPARVEDLRARFDQITWDADRIDRMSALIDAMLKRDRC